jgi:hypothetical protein
MVRVCSGRRREMTEKQYEKIKNLARSTLFLLPIKLTQAEEEHQRKLLSNGESELHWEWMMRKGADAVGVSEEEFKTNFTKELLGNSFAVIAAYNCSTCKSRMELHGREIPFHIPIDRLKLHDKDKEAINFKLLSFFILASQIVLILILVLLLR